MVDLLRELDAEVAKFVMELKNVKYSYRLQRYMYGDYRYDLDYPNTKHIPIYSSDISAAWEVVDKFDDVYRAWTLQERVNPEGRWNVCYGVCEVTANSLPLAICLAALKAKGRDISIYKELMR